MEIKKWFVYSIQFFYCLKTPNPQQALKQQWREEKEKKKEEEHWAEPNLLRGNPSAWCWLI